MKYKLLVVLFFIFLIFSCRKQKCFLDYGARYPEPAACCVARLTKVRYRNNDDDNISLISIWWKFLSHHAGMLCERHICIELGWGSCAGGYCKSYSGRCQFMIRALIIQQSRIIFVLLIRSLINSCKYVRQNLILYMKGEVKVFWKICRSYRYSMTESNCWNFFFIADFSRYYLLKFMSTYIFPHLSILKG
jgi:hypothetical protein